MNQTERREKRAIREAGGPSKQSVSIDSISGSKRKKKHEKLGLKKRLLDLGTKELY